MKKLLITLLILTLVSDTLLFSQAVGISNAAITPDASSLLEIRATDKGVLIPRVALTATNAAGPVTLPATSLLVYNTATAGAGATAVYPGYYYNGGTSAAPNWRRLITGTTSGEGWLTTGNYGTNAANNWIGTNDANDFVFKTGGILAGNERMRIDQYGNVGIGFTVIPYRFMVYDALVGGTDETATISTTSYIRADADNDAFNEPLSAIYARVQNITANRDNIVGVYGSIDNTALALGAIGVAGSVGGSFYPSWRTGVAGFYSGGNYGLSGNYDSGIDGIQLDDINADSWGGFFHNENDFNSAVIWKDGIDAYSIGDYGIKVAVYGETDYLGVQKYGGYFTVGNTGVISDATGLKGVGVLGRNTNADGIGVWGVAEFTPPTFVAANSIGGCFNAIDYGVWAKSFTAGDGIGISAIGENRAAAFELVSGSGGAFSGVDIGASDHASSGTGTGTVGVGNNSVANLLVGGSGGAFTGTVMGVYGNATSNANNTWGGYFTNGAPGASYAYVGGKTAAGVNRKIEGNGTVNTVVKDINNKEVVMTCPEAVEILFMDYGHGQLINGEVVINIDPNLSKNILVDDQHPLKVFIQLEGDCNGVYVTDKSSVSFKVKELGGGRSNVAFTYQIAAQRADEYDDNGNLVSKFVTQRWDAATPRMLPVEVQAKKTTESQMTNFPEKKKKSAEEIKPVNLPVISIDPEQ